LFDTRDSNVKDGKQFTAQQAADITQKCLTALNNCHKQNIVHRDIKPENMMFDTVGGNIKLVDFGLAIETNKKLHALAGTPYFMSPDVLKGSYGPKCDIWALGVVLYLIVTGELPFTG
jgi:calcium-dependent protein kinase